jgi:hypothetical protein
VTTGVSNRPLLRVPYNPLKPKKEREKRKWVVVLDTIFKMGRVKAKFTAMKVPRQYPARPSGKGGLERR